MLIGFSVSNYLSFKTAQTMSMAASKVARHKEHILNGNGKKINVNNLTQATTTYSVSFNWHGIPCAFLYL